LSPSRASTPLRNLTLAAASVVVFGGFIEGFARLLEPPPVQREEYLWDWSERFGDGGDFYTLEKGEGYPPDEGTNVDGMRDITRPVETRDGLTRIMILGDSVAYGHGVEAAQAFPQILERSMRASGRSVDVFNMALPGWSTRQERIGYEQIGRKYKPSEVILAVCLNDLAELQINLTKPPGFLLTLFKHSSAFRVALGASRREIGAVEELFTAPDSDRVNNAFRLFFEEVRRLRAAVTADGATFRIVVFPFRFQVESKAPAPSVQRRMADFAAAQGIPLLDLLPDLEKLEAPAGLFLDYDHLNPEGHERVARWLESGQDVLGDAATAGAPQAQEPVSSGASLARLARKTSESAREDELIKISLHVAARPATSRDKDFAALSTSVVALAVDDPSPRVRFEAARTAFTLGVPGESSVEALIRGVKHEDPRVRAFATWTLGEMGETAQAAVPALVALARQDGGAGRTGALTALGKIGGESPETVPLLLDELKHPKENRRYRAARTIGRMGPAAADAVSGLIDALHDRSALVRLHVVRALANMGDAGKTAVPALIEVMNHDPDPEVRKEVSLTLSKLPGR
jgi:lysophospholipase L1-like esterase